jgi:hypothetical protein
MSRCARPWTNLAAFLILAGIVLPGCRVFQAVNPQDPARPGNVVRLERDDMVLAYRPDLDRVVFFGASGGPNLLHTVDLDRRPAEDGSYTFFGGAYSWVAPQRSELGWRDETGELLDWPPDPAMDRGPMEIIKRTHDSLTARSPVLRSGLREYVTFTFIGGGAVEVVYELENVGDEPQQASIWILTAVKPGAHIALRRDAVENMWIDSEESEALLDDAFDFDEGYGLLDTEALQFEHGVKAYFDAEAFLAVHDQNWWFIRDGLSRPEGALKEVGEAPIALYLHPGLGLFEAELYGPLRAVAPGERLSYTEYWMLEASAPPDAAVLP